MALFSKISTRQLATKDLPLLQEIGKTTFLDTYAWGNSPESIANYIEENFSLEALEIQFKNPESTFLFATYEHEIVGYLKLNIGHAQTEEMAEEYLEIERIYVLKKHQGKKVGKALIHKAIEEAKGQGKSFIWLGVWKKNKAAISFYGKQGFEIFGEHVFHFSGEDQVDLMMRKLVG